jgi:hypothetical protein
VNCSRNEYEALVTLIRPKSMSRNALAIHSQNAASTAVGRLTFVEILTGSSVRYPLTMPGIMSIRSVTRTEAPRIANKITSVREPRWRSGASWVLSVRRAS